MVGCALSVLVGSDVPVGDCVAAGVVGGGVIVAYSCCGSTIGTCTCV